MPASPKTSDAAIVQAALGLLERGGLEAVSMQAVADAVGIRAPSLYKRFRDRAALLAAVEEAALSELAARLRRVRAAGDPRGEIRVLARAYRRYGRARPHAYGLGFRASLQPPPEAVAARAAAAAPLLERLGALLPADQVLPAARALTALLHGFVSMELAGAFHLGGDVDAAFERGLSALLDGLTASRSSSTDT